MENITTGHWVFAGLFTVAFIVLIIFAYKDDIKRSPELFKGSSRFFLAVVVTLMVLTVIKMLNRLAS